jgi:hypothetical protein
MANPVFRRSAPFTMPIVDRILLVYYGPFLAGRHTSVAHATGTHPFYADRLRGHFTFDGDEFELYLQITRFRSFLGPAPYAELITDDHYLQERAALAGELMALQRASGVVFVADPSRPDANAASLRQLPIDLREAGKDPHDVPVVFQLNKRDLIAAGLAPAFDRSLFAWPSCDFVETTAATGEGAREAMERAVRMAAAARKLRRGTER